MDNFFRRLLRKQSEGSMSPFHAKYVSSNNLLWKESQMNCKRRIAAKYHLTFTLTKTA